MSIECVLVIFVNCFKITDSGMKGENPDKKQLFDRA